MLLDRCADRRQIAALTEYRLTTFTPEGVRGPQRSYAAVGGGGRT